MTRFPLPRSFWVFTAFVIVLVAVRAAFDAVRSGFAANVAADCPASAAGASCFDLRMTVAAFDAVLAVLNTLATAFGLIAAFILARFLLESWRADPEPAAAAVGRKA
ncbi:MAG: hypothetical protein ABR562_02380 [Thermoplasmatota archaeon]